jgi:sensor histidine kinase YesM
MNLVEFIFSDKRSVRIRQHLLFWAAWYPYIVITHAGSPFGSDEISYFKYPGFIFTESFFTVLAQVPTVYLMLYFVFPRFILERKYLLSLFWIIILWFICGTFTLILSVKVMPSVLALLMSPESIPSPPDIPKPNFLEGIMSVNRGAYLITANALMIKIGKHWYRKQHLNLQLQKENAEAQLQLLTAQVHPHFLFNTLNNIFSKTQTESPNGSLMIMSLSEMLRYILYEGQKPLVPLEQELAMISEYIKLEQLRYGTELEAHIRTPDRTENICVAPMLLLPFVENCFRSSQGDMIQHPWINLSVELKDITLVMKLMNGKTPVKEGDSSERGRGLLNVKQRLDLLYKGKYELKIREDEEVFVVDLQVELVKIEDKTQEEPVSEPNPNSAYA